MLSTTVKISNVTNLSDARYCAGMGVALLGFSIDPADASYVAANKFEEIRSWVAGVQMVAETTQTDPKRILDTLAGYAVDALQVQEPNVLSYLKSELALPLLLRVNVDTYAADELDALMSRYAAYVEYFLLESDHNAPLTADWLHSLGQLTTDYPVLVGFGLDEVPTVESLRQQVPASGLALRGSAEIRPGYKDFGTLMDILEALEEE
ncbi:hypothetical protein GCM10027275_42440 [Rhabdobacter roseus]|uniref:Phosphoribosylanthranilate isomerase n=1 Tax=Rhabdobacter roseus TaxID=1655419 RepID=A0A840TY57_9BACT|nr:hypothetical protein [Rhabdobacter roseus]MBB5286223.1 phosphoribosylanthranilate isomerase [Rhabdobacter roseus]